MNLLEGLSVACLTGSFLATAGAAIDFAAMDCEDRQRVRTNGISFYKTGPGQVIFTTLAASILLAIISKVL